MDRLTPSEIIAMLDVETIDSEIEKLKEEINALQALRKVAIAKNGQAPATKAGGRTGISRKMQELLETAVQVLKKWESLDASKLAERAGCRANNTHWFLKAIAKDPRFVVNGETVTLATPSE
jgi:hypothetical protein